MGYWAATAGMFVVMILAMVRAFAGPTLYDRILAVNMFGTKTVLFLAVLAFAGGVPYVLDIALTYALINFTAVVAVLRHVETGGARRKEDA
ncbi:MAG: pH regulation protein F [Gammaproteobacteria bacterium]|nr:MAG: pH regulation protein F [Gammaproteobacteria bacterium]